MSIEGSRDATRSSKVYTFLERTGFLSLAEDDESFHSWIGGTSFEDFRSYIERLNGMLRDLPIKDRSFDVGGVSITDSDDSIVYIPPNEKDKELLLRHVFSLISSMPRQDAGLLLYYVIQAVHPFYDGNGRVGRLLYLLLEDRNDEEKLNQDSFEEVLTSENSKVGRKEFKEKVVAPELVYRSIHSVMTMDEFGEDILHEYSGIDSGLHPGHIATYKNEKVIPETKQRLDAYMSEAGKGLYKFRDIVLLKYLKEKGTYDEFVEGKDSEWTEKQVLSFDGEEILKGINQEDAEEIIRMYDHMKQQFVEKLCDVIAHPDSYKVQGKPLKDYFYKNR